MGVAVQQTLRKALGCILPHPERHVQHQPKPRYALLRAAQADYSGALGTRPSPRARDGCRPGATSAFPSRAACCRWATTTRGPASACAALPRAHGVWLPPRRWLARFQALQGSTKNRLSLGDNSPAGEEPQQPEGLRQTLFAWGRSPRASRAGGGIGAKRRLSDAGSQSWQRPSPILCVR